MIALFASTRRAHQRNSAIIYGHGTRMEANRSAEAQHKSHHRPEQIGASVFERIIFRPISPHFASAAVDDESRSIPIKEAKMLSAGEQTDAQVWLAAGHHV